MLNEKEIELFRKDAELLQTDLCKQSEEEKQLYRSYLVDGYTMLSTVHEQMDCLLDPILPRVGVAALVGSSDSGKSTLLRGLAMAVASGAGNYLNFRLNQRHNRAIYVSTEDDQAALSVLMTRQIAELATTKEHYSKLSFIFDTTNLLTTLDAALSDVPTDLVVIDAFADLYTGPLNENNRVRSFLNAFSQLSQRHSTLIIFLHHTGKRTESLAPSKHNAIGSQGFEAKMRLVMELRTDPTRHDIRHLCFVKGNYLSQEFKHDSFELRFTPGLNFVATGERTPFALLRDRSDEEEDNSNLELMRQMRAEGKTYREIANELGYKSHASVIKRLK